MSVDERSGFLRSCPPAWLFAVVYALHLLDEGIIAGGLPEWSTQIGFHMSIANWLPVSSISFVVFITAVALVARRTWPSWVLISLAVHILLHALIHLGASTWWRSLSPGVISGVVLAFPLAIWTSYWAIHALDRRTLTRAVAIGALSFQAPWDLTVRLIFGLPIWTS
jgi:hypothetical protein